MIVYGAITVFLTLIASKMPKLRKYINGSPTIIMNNGKLYRKNMKKSKIDLTEFLVLCRQEGYFNLNDIQTAIFEYNGRLTILPISTKRPLIPEDINLNPDSEYINTELIMDGRILEENLKRKGLDLNWLQNQITNQGYNSAKDIFLGICDNNNQLTLYKYE